MRVPRPLVRMCRAGLTAETIEGKRLVRWGALGLTLWLVAVRKLSHLASRHLLARDGQGANWLRGYFTTTLLLLVLQLLVTMLLIFPRGTTARLLLARLLLLQQAAFFVYCSAFLLCLINIGLG